MKISLIASLLTLCSICYGQLNDSTSTQDSLKNDQEEIFYVVDKPAQFPGGIGKFYEYVNKNMNYPKEAKRQGIEGRVFVEFVVDSTGFIKPDEIRINKSVYKPLDDEAIRLIRESPRWIPGFVTELNKNVPQRFVMPITFKL